MSFDLEEEFEKISYNELALNNQPKEKKMEVVEETFESLYNNLPSNIRLSQSKK